MSAELEQEIEMDRDEAINIIARVFHSGEEIEGPDGLAMMVDMTVWNDACEALEDIVGDLDEPSNPDFDEPQPR